jgi:LPXTG-site transpeptidase (sortase) family protein
MHKRGPLFWVGSAVTFCGAALMAVLSYNFLDATRAQKQAKEWLNATAPTVRAAVRPPVRPPVQRGDVVGELTIPRLNMSVMVFEGDDEAILKLGAGHIPGTNGIAAHRDTFFRPLRGILPKDVITLRTPEGPSRFEVTETEIVWPSDVQVLDPGVGRDLTLVTCYPFSFMGHAPRRFIVHARQVALEVQTLPHRESDEVSWSKN